MRGALDHRLRSARRLSLACPPCACLCRWSIGLLPVTQRGQHDALHRSAARLLAALAVPAVADHLPVRARDRRSDRAAGRARSQPGRHRRHPRAVRPRSADLGAVLELHGEPGARRPRPVVLLPHAGARALPLAPAELAAAGARGHGLLAADRHPERHPRRGARRPLLGPGGQGVLAARPVAALVLGRPGADPVLLGLPGVAAVVGLGHGVAPAHAGLRAGLVLRRRAHAADALLHARGAGLGVHQARPPQGPAGVPRHRQARLQERPDPGADAGRASTSSS